MYFHGAHTSFAPHQGLCLADELRVAVAYAGSNGEIALIEVDYAGLNVAEVEGYNNDNDTAPGDDGDNRGADVLEFRDSGPHGHMHNTVRMMTAAAVSAITVVAVVPAAWAIVLDDACVPFRDWAATVSAWTDAGADEDDFDMYGPDGLAEWRDDNA